MYLQIIFLIFCQHLLVHEFLGLICLSSDDPRIKEFVCISPVNDHSSEVPPTLLASALTMALCCIFFKQ